MYSNTFPKVLSFVLLLAIIAVSSTLKNELYAQKAITYEQTQDVEYAKNINNYEKFESYTSKDGSEIKVGSQLKLGVPIGGHKEFTYILFGRGQNLMSLLGGQQKMGIAASNELVEITDISVYHTKLAKRSPLKVNVSVQVVGGARIEDRTIYDYELALQSGEITNPNRLMTREEAIAKLKEAKDLMDLGLMTEADYNKLREELTPIIMGNKQQ